MKLPRLQFRDGGPEIGGALAGEDYAPLLRSRQFGRVAISRPPQIEHRSFRPDVGHRHVRRPFFRVENGVVLTGLARCQDGPDAVLAHVGERHRLDDRRPGHGRDAAQA